MDFTTWMIRVQEKIREQCDIDIDDLPDFPYRDSFDAGDTPEICADEVLEENGLLYPEDEEDEEIIDEDDEPGSDAGRSEFYSPTKRL